MESQASVAPEGNSFVSSRLQLDSLFYFILICFTYLIYSFITVQTRSLSYLDPFRSCLSEHFVRQQTSLLPIVDPPWLQIICITYKLSSNGSSIIKMAAQSVLHSSTVSTPISLTTLLRRLEAATLRLEDIATSVILPSESPTTAATPASPPNGAPTPVIIPPTPTPKPSPKAEYVPKEVQDFGAIISGDVATYIKLSNLDPLLAQQAQLVRECFNSERFILLLSSKAKKPKEGSQEYMEVYKDLQTKMIAVGDIREKNRGSTFKDHLALVADGIQALGWIVLDNKPAEQAAELFGGAQMWGNKLLQAHKNKCVSIEIQEANC